MPATMQAVTSTGKQYFATFTAGTSQVARVSRSVLAPKAIGIAGAGNRSPLGIDPPNSGGLV